MHLYVEQFAGATLIDIALKATLVIAIAAALTAILRNTTASTRHAIWLTATVMLLVLPIAELALPQIGLPLLPAEPIAADAGVLSVPVEIQPRFAPPAISTAISTALSAVLPAKWTPSTALMFVWGVGVLLMIVRAAVGLVRLQRIRRSGVSINGPGWQRTLEQVKQQTQIRRPVRLLMSPANAPMTWGLWRIYVCLPSHADQWSGTDRSMVLTHELTHVRRGDHAWQMLAITMTAVHWFNPLAWWAAHRLRMEAETACDAAVIAAGCRPSEYANCLCQMVRAAKAAPSRLEPALSMARPSELPRRLAMILDINTKHRAARFRTLVLSLIPSAVIGSVLGVVQVSRVQADDGENTAAVETTNADDEALDNINANPTEEVGVYHVTPVFKKLVKATVIKRKGPYGPDHTRILDGWAFDRESGRLTVQESVSDEQEMVIAQGNRVVPWMWRMPHAISSVQVLIGKRVAVRGEDFDVDEAAGTVQLLKHEHCRPEVEYYISYKYRDDPAAGGAVGNFSDTEVIRKLLQE